MQSIPQLFLLWLAFDEFLYNFQFVFAARLKSAGVVKNVAIMVCEDEFVIDVVFTTLQAGILWSAVANIDKPIKPLLWGRVEPG